MIHNIGRHILRGSLRRRCPVSHGDAMSHIGEHLQIIRAVAERIRILPGNPKYVTYLRYSGRLGVALRHHFNQLRIVFNHIKMRHQLRFHRTHARPVHISAQFVDLILRLPADLPHILSQFPAKVLDKRVFLKVFPVRVDITRPLQHCFHVVRPDDAQKCFRLIRSKQPLRNLLSFIFNMRAARRHNSVKSDSKDLLTADV